MHSRKLLAPASFAAISILTAGCDIIGPGWSRRLGLVMESTPPMTSLIAPDAVTRGTPFQITASSFGSGSCTRDDGYEVNPSAMAFEVTLYDESASAGMACTADLKRIARILTVQFDQAGTAEIRVIGRGEGDDGMATRTIRKTIVVQ